MTTAGSTAAGGPALSPRELSKFERLLGRMPDETEQVKLFRLKEALGLEDNDEVWTFVLALQHYEFLYEQHPAQIEEVLKRSVSELQATAEKAVQAEVARIRGLLEKTVAAAAASVATARAETSRRLAWWWAGAGLALFGGLCLVCGFELGRGGLPFWMRREVALEGGPVTKVVGAILGAPAGWAAFLLLLPVCWTWGRRAWDRAVDEEESTRVRAGAWSAVVSAAIGCAAAAAGLLWLIGSVTVGAPSSGREPRQTAVLAGTDVPGVAAAPRAGQDSPVHRAM